MNPYVITPVGMIDQPIFFVHREPLPKKYYTGKSRKKKKNMNTVSKQLRRKHRRAKR